MYHSFKGYGLIACLINKYGVMMNKIVNPCWILTYESGGKERGGNYFPELKYHHQTFIGV